MAHPEVAIHPYIGHSDGCPSRASQLDSGEVKRGDIVGIMLKTATYTPEEGLASPVSFKSQFLSTTKVGERENE
jgi:hypothetical protein